MTQTLMKKIALIISVITTLILVNAPYAFAENKKESDDRGREKTSVARSRDKDSDDERAGRKKKVRKPPSFTTNLILNPSLETAGADGDPINWRRGSWGAHNAFFSYPVPGISGGKAVKVSITSHSDGDAKWYFDDVAVKENIVYAFSESYKSNAASSLVARYTLADNSLTYQFFKTLPSTDGVWASLSQEFAVPIGAVSVTMFHILGGVGELTIDNAALKPITTATPPPTGGDSFTNGIVSLTFDDGWTSQYNNALPILNGAGQKGTFYIISKVNPAYGYMTSTQILALKAAGHEIGAHTRTHASLVQLSPADAQLEINGSREDLLSIGAGPITSFAYPYGDFNASVMDMVKNAGLTAARTVVPGFNMKTSDKFTLKTQSVEANTPLSSIISWIDAAVAQKTWLILVFHQIETNPGQYGTTPEILSQITSYMNSRGIKAKTVDEALRLMSS